MLDIFAELSGLTLVAQDISTSLLRIAQALERLSPPLPVVESSAQNAQNATGVSDGFYLAESPEEYQARTSKEAELAISLGVAPWSPAFQQAIQDMRSDLRGHKMKDENGQVQELTEDEITQAIKDAFFEAKGQANKR